MRFQSFAHIGKKLSNIFNRFYTFFSLFYTFFQTFRNFSHFLTVFKHELARLMRKSALLIEILTHLRINLCVWCYPILLIFPILTKMLSLSNHLTSNLFFSKSTQFQFFFFVNACKILNW